jgi:ATP-dependent exoDNAse (exonuclease V) beta subunit
MDGAAQRWHEVPYSVLADGGVESGIIDALYRRDGGWTLVEFKTDDVRSEAELERVLATGDYRTQMARYVAAAEALLGARPQAILCMLNYRGGVRLVEL